MKFAAVKEAEVKGRQGEVCVPAEAMLTTFSGEDGSNRPGLPPPDFAGEAPSCWLMLPCCCCRKSRKRVTVTPPAGLGAIGIGRVGVPVPLDGRSLIGVVGFLPPGEKS